MKYLPFLAILFIACQPLAKVYPGKYANTYEPLGASEPFLLIEVDTVRMENADRIAGIRIGESGMTVNCSYSSVISLAEQKARSLGGNCFVVKQVVWPDAWSSCYRIAGDVYRLKDPEILSNRIYWSANRPLKIADYKASTANRDDIAGTFTGLLLKSSENEDGKLVAEVRAFFDCDSSYFVQSGYNFEFFKHEKLHFDIAELQARKLRKLLHDEVHTVAEFKERKSSLIDSANAACLRMREAYVSEVEEEPIMQDKWNADIAIKLMNYDQYADPKIIIE
jgi:hypothetical protein